MIDGEEVIMIGPFSPEDAEQLFRSKIPRADNSSTTTIQILLKELGFIPLAITQAAAFVRENSITVAEYTEELVKDDSHLQEYLFEDLPDFRRDSASVNSVVRTWKLSFDRITVQNPQAANLLSLMAVLDRQAIPQSFLQQNLERSIDFIKALGTLKAFSLITVEKGGSIFEVHRLVHLSTRKWLALEGTQEKWQKRALGLMVENFPTGEHETWKACQVLLSHALAALQYSYLLEDDDMALQRAGLLENLARYDENQGRYDVARSRYEEVYQVRMKVLGKEHPDTLISMTNLAVVLTRQGKYEEAEQMQRQELELREKVLGKEHPETLASMNNLAVVLTQRGKYEEAEQIFRQTLSLREKVSGKKHPDTLLSLNNLASVLKSQGKYEEAEQIH